MAHFGVGSPTGMVAASSRWSKASPALCNRRFIPQVEEWLLPI